MVAAGVQESRSKKVSGGPSLEYTYIISTIVYWQPRFKGWENRLHFSIGGAVKNYGHFCNYHNNSEENIPVHYTRPEYLVMLNQMPLLENPINILKQILETITYVYFHHKKLKSIQFANHKKKKLNPII